ncbi:MAG: hypothetical protein ABSE76_03020 [Minisyncoccia bacterium]|jgi:hypothetical protein
MATITIPKKIAGSGDLVVLPRKEYEALVYRAEASTAAPKKARKLSAGLRQALREVDEGKLSGPFHSVAELMADLES